MAAGVSPGCQAKEKLGWLSTQVPQIPRAHGHSRVKVAVLVSFPPEPFFFSNLAHLDHAIQVWHKASQKKPLGMDDELQSDGQVNGARKTYE